MSLKDIFKNIGDSMKINLNERNIDVSSSAGFKTIINKMFDLIDEKADKIDLVDIIYPVGSIYISVNNTNPSILFGGTWEKIEDKFLLGSSSNYVLGDTGGSKDAIVVSHTHTQNSHSHGFGTNAAVPKISSSDNWAYTSKGKMTLATGNNYYPYSIENNNGIGEATSTTSDTATNKSTGVDGTGKNMPPYLVVNIWKRINSEGETLFYDDCSGVDIYQKYNVSSNITSLYVEYQGFNTLHSVTVQGTDGTLELKDFTVSPNVDWIMTYDMLHTNMWTSGGLGINESLDIFSISGDGNGVHCDMRTSTDVWNSIKIIKNGSTYSVYVNDVFKGTTINTNTGTLKFNIRGDRDNYVYYLKNIKIV